MGQWYGYGPDYQSVQPHIGYIGLYYCSGAVGLLIFAIFIIYFTIMIFRVMHLYKGHQYEYLAVFIMLVWVNMLFFAAANPVFYLEDNIILVSAAALAIVMAKLYNKNKNPAPKNSIAGSDSF